MKHCMKSFFGNKVVVVVVVEIVFCFRKPIWLLVTSVKTLIQSLDYCRYMQSVDIKLSLQCSCFS